MNTTATATRRATWIAAAVLVAASVAACASATPTPPSSPTPPGAANDHLARILARGTILLYAELDYPPQSIRVEDATRPAGTKCQGNQLTGAEVTGYDIETSKLVAAALGVEPCFVSFPFEELNAGNWGDRVDLAYASGSINADRLTRFYMTQPYYGTPNHYFVREDSPFEEAADLSGREIGSCSGCTHELYLKRELEIPGVTLTFDVDDPRLVSYAGEVPGLEDVANGSIDAFLCAEPVGKAQIDGGLPLRALQPAAFLFYPSGWIDRGSAYEPRAFFDRVNEIVQGLHADGTLRALSEEWFATDYASGGGAFDITATDQQVP
jgi:polar amino acid transport system substrate-binding protein